MGENLLLVPYGFVLRKTLGFPASGGNVRQDKGGTIGKVRMGRWHMNQSQCPASHT